MSVIDSRHNVVAFVAGESKAFEGQRLAKVGYKTTAKQKAKYKSVCVSIPTIDTDSEEFNNLIGSGRLDPYIKAMMENAQDGILKSLYESSEGTLSSVSDDDLGFNAIIGFLENESAGGRLTKEFLNSWFDANVADNLTVAIAMKLGFNDPTEKQLEQVDKHVKVYKELISSLSGGATVLQSAQIAGVRKALEIASVEDDTAKKLEARLVKMEKPAEIEMVL